MFIRKSIDLKNKIQDAIYVYLILDKKSGKTYSSIDTELVKIYSKNDIERLTKDKFKIYKILGGYSNFPYNKNNSDRMIFIFCKINNIL